MRADGTLEHLPFAARPELPAALNDALDRALQVDARERWPSAGAMSEALESWLTSAGHTVLPSDVTRFLAEVYGATGIEPAPVSLGDDVGDTGVQRAFPGTAPLPSSRVHGTAPLSPAADAPARLTSQPLLAAVPHLAPPPAARRPGPWIALAGAATALVFLTVTLVAIAGSKAPRRSDAQPAAQPPPPVELPELSLEQDAAGPDTVPPPVERPVEPTTARPVAKKPPPARKQKTGRVTVRVNPWAEVYLANRKLGVTPFEPVDVPAGTATFTLKNPQLGVTRKVTVKVPAGGNVVLRADLFK